MKERSDTDDPWDVRHSYVSGKGVEREQARLAAENDAEGYSWRTSLNDWVQAAMEEGKSDLFILKRARYTFGEHAPESELQRFEAERGIVRPPVAERTDEGAED